MPSVFELFGELKADTGAFKRALSDADARLLATGQNVAALEAKTAGFGRTTNLSARFIEKYNEQIGGVRERMLAAGAAFERGDITAKQMAGEIARAEKATAGLNNRIADSSARLSDWAARKTDVINRLQTAGAALQDFGGSLVRYLTLPLAGFAAAAIKSATNVDDLRNKLVSATGSVDGANAKIADLRKLSAQSAGVLTSFAADTYAFLKPMGLGEKTIEGFTKALGRLRLTDSGIDAKEFGLNLSQLFTQNFELQDLKQLVGRFPRAAELLAKQFGIKSSDLSSLQAGFKHLKKTGALTLESFIAGFADAVESDPALAKLTDTIGTRFAKLFERLSFALEPLGHAILSVVEPLIEPLTQLIEFLAAKFQQLSPYIQTAVVAFGGLLATAGPVLLVLGSILTTVAGVISALAGLTAAGTVAAGLIVVAKGVAVALAAIVAAATVLTTLATGVYALYQAWLVNFGGIRDLTTQVWATVLSVSTTVLGELNAFAAQTLGQIVALWQQNWPLIQQTVQTVSEALKATVQTLLSAIQAFWQRHGETILSVVSAAWQAIQTIISTIIEQISNIIQIVANIINGDWAAAWDAFLQYVQTAVAAVASVLSGWAEIWVKIQAQVLAVLFEFGAAIGKTLVDWTIKAVTGTLYILATLPVQIARLVPAMIAAGSQLASAIWQGLKQGIFGGGGGGNGPAPAIPLSSLLPSFDSLKNFFGGGGGAITAASLNVPKAPLIDIESKEEKKAREAAEKAAQKMREQVRDIRNEMFSSISNFTQNPFVKIYQDAGAAIERARQLTAGFNKETQTALLRAVQLSNEYNRFKAAVDNALKASNLKAEAQKFLTAGAKGGAISSSTFDFTGGKAGALLSTDYAAIARAGADSFTEDQLEKQKELARQIAAVRSQPLSAKASERAIQERVIDQAIISLTSGLDPKDLRADQNILAAQARNREAERLANQEADAAAVFSKLKDQFGEKGLKVDLQNQAATVVHVTGLDAQVTKQAAAASASERDTRQAMDVP